MGATPRKSMKDAVIEYVLDRPKQRVKVTEIARQLHASKGYVSKTVSNMKKDGLIKNSLVNLGDPYVRSLKTSINLDKIRRSGIISAIKRIGVRGAGLYGSWANGTNTEDSDIDLWLKLSGDTAAILVGGLRQQIIERLHVEPQIIILGQNKINALRKDNEVFYFTLLFGSIILMGEGIGQI